MKLLDLTGSNLKTLDAQLGIKSLGPTLRTLRLSFNPNIDKSDIVELLKSQNLIDHLKELHLAGLNANSDNLPIHNLILNSNNSALESLDLSWNNYTKDLNVFIFNQPNLQNLKLLNLTRNSFSHCNKKLITGVDKTLLKNLEHIDLSWNKLNDSSCFLSLKSITTVKYLDMNHNYLKLFASDYRSDDFAMFFSNKQNLSYIDLSYNQLPNLILYFSPDHVKIDKFDLSYNNMRKFQILSLTSVEKGKYPFNLKLENNSNNKKNLKNKLNNKNQTENDYYDENYIFEEDENEDDDDYEDEEENIISGGGARRKTSDLDDDQRFIQIDFLDLSHNKFELLNVQHVLQSIKNVITLDLSFNPMEQVIGN